LLHDGNKKTPPAGSLLEFLGIALRSSGGKAVKAPASEARKVKTGLLSAEDALE